MSQQPSFDPRATKPVSEQAEAGPARDIVPIRRAATAVEPAPSQPASEPAKPSRTGRRIAIAVVVATAAIAGGTGYAMHSRHFESTDDAFVDGPIAQLSPQVAGRVLAVATADNAYVHAGDVLVQIDPADFEVRVEQAQAARAEAEGHLAQAEAQVGVSRAALEQSRADVQAATADAGNASADLRRFRSTVAGAVSQQALDGAATGATRATAHLAQARAQVDAAQSQLDLANTQVKTAEASVQAAEASYAQARLQLEYTRIRASRDGRVTRKSVEVGDYVQPGQALLALVGDDLWVTANFKETQLADMRIGQPVELDVDAFPAHALRGHVDSIQAGAASRFSLMPPENATGNYVKVVQRVPVKIALDEPESALKLLGPGMSVVPEVRVR